MFLLFCYYRRMKEKLNKDDRQKAWGSIRRQYELGRPVAGIKEVVSGFVNIGSVYRKATKDGWNKDLVQETIGAVHAKNTEERNVEAEIKKDVAEIDNADKALKVKKASREIKVTPSIEEIEEDVYINGSKVLSSLAMEIEDDYSNIIKGSRFVYGKLLKVLKGTPNDELTIQDCNVAITCIAAAKKLLVGDEFSRGAVLKMMIEDSLNLSPEQRREKVIEATYRKALDGDSRAMEAYLKSNSHSEEPTPWSEIKSAIDD